MTTHNINKIKPFSPEKSSAKINRFSGARIWIRNKRKNVAGGMDGYTAGRGRRTGKRVKGWKGKGRGGKSSESWGWE